MRSLKSLRFWWLTLPLLACVGARPVPSREHERGPVLFTVTHPSHPGATLQLLGTVHLERADYRLDRAVEQAIDAAQDVYVEIDLDDDETARLQQAVMSRAALPEGKTARDVLAPETWAALERECTRLHVDVTRLAHFSPWMIQLTLSVLNIQQADPSLRSELGIDKRVMATAHAAHTPVHSLESVDFQLDLLSWGDAESQDANLASTLKELNKPSLINEMFTAWEAGDLPSLERLMVKPDEAKARSAQFKRFWIDRNQAMFDKLQPHFATTHRGLVAVGAGHLLGEQGLVRLFERAGYVVERAASLGPGAAWNPPWPVVKEDGFEVSFPAAPKRTATPLPNGANTTVWLWQTQSLAFAIEATFAPHLAEALASRRFDIFAPVVKALSAGRTVEKSEQVQFLGKPALRVLIVGGTPAATIEVIIVDDHDTVYSLRAVSTLAAEHVPHADFERFFSGLSVPK